MFTMKMLIGFMVAISISVSFRYALPVITGLPHEYIVQMIFNIEFITFFLSCGALMVLMHYFGFMEGKREGYSKGIVEAEHPYVFLPHGGLD